jgi:TetR/AcrR family tetracycline transcriptional repressor
MELEHRAATQARRVAVAAHPEQHPAPDGAMVDRTDGVRREPLSCVRIIEAAVRYVDSNCLDELSMRRLGSELGVEAMSLYRYFPSKGALLDAVVGWLLRDLAMPEEGGTQDWESQVRDFAVSFRSITRQHPHLMPLLTVRSPDDPLLQGIHDRMIEVWRRAGLSAEDAQSAQRALQSYLSGSSQWHQESCQGHAAEKDFRYGLEVFLDGVRSRVAEAAAVS